MAALPTSLGVLGALAVLVRILMAKPADGMEPSDYQKQAGRWKYPYKCPQCSATGGKDNEGDATPVCPTDRVLMLPVGK